ncbi:MAG: penicillin-binding protein, partial [Solirubrobacterales bacterium]|nr:penicillin-binding protein [Solirubrobacterales bacterium]
MSRRERQRRRQRGRGHPLRRMILISALVIFGGLTIGVLAAIGWVVSVAASAPNINHLKPHTAGQLSEIYAANGEPLGYIDSTVLRTPVTGNRIPLALKHATVAVEDRRFYQHGALDYTGILRAAIKDVLSGGGHLQGASTLTMQLVDNLYLKSVTHNLHYKVIQAKMAEQLFSEHSRSWILDNYLNDVPYGTVGGQTAYGVQAASELFFDKPVSKLNLAQAALLAGLPQAPSQYNPFISPTLARQRRATVLQAMVTAHYITQAQANAANSQPLQAKHTVQFSQKRLPYVFDYVLQELHQRFCPGRSSTAPCAAVDHGGLKVYTTIQPRDEAMAKQSILAYEGGPGQPAAALASVNPANGDIVAIANSSSYAQSRFDYATQGYRSPGSSFKVFALMTLIHDYDGDPSQTFYNSHFLAPGWLPSDPTWSVHTAEKTYQGRISVTKATILSDNTVFAQLVVDLGMNKFDRMAHAMGITSVLTANPAEVIGGLKYGVSTLEMADAYATLADGGLHRAPHAISRVVFPNGRTVSFDQAGNRVFSDGEAYAATKVLESVITQGTGTPANYGCPAAGKTGTAQNLSNAWFVGYTPKLSTAVWVGYPNNNNITVGFGGPTAGPIWRDFMQTASNGYCGSFSPPAVPWTGTRFTGAHSVAKPSAPAPVPAPAQIPGPSTTQQTFTAAPQPPPAVVPGTSPGPKKNGGPPPGSP